MTSPPQIQPVELCNAVGGCKSSPSSYASALSTYRTPSARTVASHALAQLEAARAKDIATDVLSCLEDFCDGRVFRDTTWCYSRLFESAADQQLSADVQQALRRAGDDE